MLKQKFSLIRLLCFLMIIGMIATGCSENPSASETKTPDSSLYITGAKKLYVRNGGCHHWAYGL